MFSKLIKNKKELIALLKEHKVTKAYIFGSAVTDKFNDKSDIDFLIKFSENLQPIEKGELWWKLHDKLRDYFQREIDIITENSLKNPYFIKELDETKQLIYVQE